MCDSLCRLCMVYHRVYVSFQKKKRSSFEVEIVFVRFDVCLVNGGLLGLNRVAVNFRPIPPCKFTSDKIAEVKLTLETVCFLNFPGGLVWYSCILWPRSRRENLRLADSSESASELVVASQTALSICG